MLGPGGPGPADSIVWSELFVDFTEHAMPCKRYQLGIRPVSSGLNPIILITFDRDSCSNACDAEHGARLYSWAKIGLIGASPRWAQVTMGK